MAATEVCGFTALANDNQPRISLKLLNGLNHIAMPQAGAHISSPHGLNPSLSVFKNRPPTFLGEPRLLRIEVCQFFE